MSERKKELQSYWKNRCEKTDARIERIASLERDGECYRERIHELEAELADHKDALRCALGQDKVSDDDLRNAWERSSVCVELQAEILEAEAELAALRSHCRICGRPPSASGADGLHGHICTFDLPSEPLPAEVVAFSKRNKDRCESPQGFNHKLDSWSLSDWMTATAGELGEAANIIKKLNRVRDGIPGNKETPADLQQSLAEEIADVAIYLDLLAQAAGFDLETIREKKFAKTSKKIGYAVFATPGSVNAGRESSLRHALRYVGATTTERLCEVIRQDKQAAGTRDCSSHSPAESQDAPPPVDSPSPFPSPRTAFERTEAQRHFQTHSHDTNSGYVADAICDLTNQLEALAARMKKLEARQ